LWIIDNGTLGTATEDFHPSDNVADAERYVAAAGSRLVAVEHTIHVANATAESIGIVQRAGLVLPDEIRIDHSIFRTLDRPPATPGYFAPASNSVYLNPDARFYAGGADGMLKMARMAYERGWWSTDNPIGPVLHELGHAAHWGVSQEAYLHAQHARFSEAERDLVRRRLSEYGSTEPLQLVAEVIAAKLTGFVIHADVLDLYRRFGGPKL